MLRVSPSPRHTDRVPSTHSHGASPSARKVFIPSKLKPFETAPNPRVRNFKVVELKKFPMKQSIDLKKASLHVHHILISAQELAQKNEIAIEGPPSDSLESLLAMRIKQIQK